MAWAQRQGWWCRRRVLARRARIPQAGAVMADLLCCVAGGSRCTARRRVRGGGVALEVLSAQGHRRPKQADAF